MHGTTEREVDGGGEEEHEENWLWGKDEEVDEVTRCGF